MPKATLEYNLPEEYEHFRDAAAGTEWRGVVNDLYSFMRNKTKVTENSQVYETVDEIVNHLFHLVRESNLEL